MDDEKFRTIDKIKTVGSTYMAALGLTPEHRIDESNESLHLSTLVEFVFCLKDRLMAINENSYNNFMLRAGINFGPVVAGVIGMFFPYWMQESCIL